MLTIAVGFSSLEYLLTKYKEPVITLHDFLMISVDVVTVVTSVQTKANDHFYIDLSHHVLFLLVKANFIHCLLV